ncbi:MAG TPA: oligoendopeptidase F [Chloroflexia bacterium]|nr:oligoendopeptidase F [Chloroflexia bacterium]
MAKTLPQRSEVTEERQWNLASVYPSDAAWEAACAQAHAAIPGMARFRGTLGESGATLLEGLQARDALLTLADRLVLYPGMQLAGDSTNQVYTARNEQAGSLAARVAGAVAFVEPEILAIPPERRQTLVADTPGLGIYAHYFATLDQHRDHIRSAEVEDLLALAGDVMYSPARIHFTLEDADLKFATIPDEDGTAVEIAQSTVWPLIRSRTRAVRQAAWEAYADGYLSVKNAMAATLVGAIKRDVFYARARHYPTALDAALGADNIPAQVFHNLLDTYRRHLPVWHRYFEIRRRALGVDTLAVYDLHVPLVRTQHPIPYPEAVATICAGMAPLGAEYVEPMRRGVGAERWVDAYPNQGKGSGAFSSGVYGTHPFLMLNYDDTLQTLSTLAHELGHSMHSYFTWQTQPPVYGRYSMFVAETASNFNQALVRAHLLQTHTDAEFQLELLAEALANFYRYFFIMPTLARFELECHTRVERGEGLSASALSAIMIDLLREGYGPAMAIDEARAGILWAQFSHLFANFYVYQYATGISAATALADGVLRDGAPAAQRYLDFLKAGNSLYSIDALRLAGVDMTAPEPVERAFGVLADLVDRLDGLVGPGPLHG